MNALLGRLWVGAQSRSVRNVLYVGAVQAVTLVIPLVTLPWILRALQPGAYGAYALALAFGQYAVIFVDFGFYLAATQRIAQIRDDRAQVTRYFWTVQFARFLLAIVGVVIAICIIFAVPKFHAIAWVMAANLPVVIGTLLYPQWLFLGLERVRTVSVANIAARILSAVPIFFLVHTPSDAGTAAFLSASNTIVAGLISSLLIAKSRLVGRFRLPTLSEVIEVYKEAWPLFVSASAVSLYAASNAVVLGIVRDNYQVGVFNAADKLRIVFLTPINPISTVFYPRVSRLMIEDRSQAIGTIVNLMVVLGGGMACVSTALFFSAPLLVQLFMGDNFAEAVPVLRILSIVPFLVGLNTVLGNMAMLNLGMKKQYSRIIVVGGLVNVLLLVVLGWLYGAQGAAMSLTTTEALVTAWMAFLLYRQGFLGEAVQVFSGKLRPLSSRDR